MLVAGLVTLVQLAACGPCRRARFLLLWVQARLHRRIPESVVGVMGRIVPLWRYRGRLYLVVFETVLGAF